MQDIATNSQDTRVLDNIAQYLENVSPTELWPHMRLGLKRSCTDRKDIDPPCSQDQKDPGTRQPRARDS